MAGPGMAGPGMAGPGTAELQLGMLNPGRPSPIAGNPPITLIAFPRADNSEFRIPNSEFPQPFPRVDNSKLRIEN